MRCRQMIKAAFAAAAVMTALDLIPAQAAYWQDTAAGPKYIVNNTYTYKDGWHVIDGYYYYFNPDGTAAVSCATPDGYTVNELGQWTVNGTAEFTDDFRAPAKQFMDEHDAAVKADAAAGTDYYQYRYGKNAAEAESFYKDTCSRLSEFFGSFDWIHAGDMEKLKKCYERLACGYSGNTYGGDHKSSYNWSVLVTGNGVCEDYAYDLSSLLNLAGLESYRLIINDYPGLSHAAVLVKADGKWYTADPAVGDGMLKEADISKLFDFNSGETMYEIRNNLRHGHTGRDYSVTGEPNRTVGILYCDYCSFSEVSLN